MNRIQLLLANVKAQALMRQVMEKHMRDFAPIQPSAVSGQQSAQQPQAGENVPTPTNPGNETETQAAQLPPDQSY